MRHGRRGRPLDPPTPRALRSPQQTAARCCGACRLRPLPRRRRLHRRLQWQPPRRPQPRPVRTRMRPKPGPGRKQRLRHSRAARQGRAAGGVGTPRIEAAARGTGKALAAVPRRRAAPAGRCSWGASMQPPAPSTTHTRCPHACGARPTPPRAHPPPPPRAALRPKRDACGAARVRTSSAASSSSTRCRTCRRTLSCSRSGPRAAPRGSRVETSDALPCRAQGSHLTRKRLKPLAARPHPRRSIPSTRCGIFGAGPAPVRSRRPTRTRCPC